MLAVFPAVVVVVVEDLDIEMVETPVRVSVPCERSLR